MFVDLSSYSDLALFLLRLTIASIFLVHAFRKLSNSKTVGPFFTGLGAWELVWSILLAAGLYTQYAALALLIVMLGALYHKIFKWKMKFMEEKATGWELDLILLAALILILTLGPGSIALSL
jgi:putative oxidoreductase